MGAFASRTHTQEVVAYFEHMALKTNMHHTYNTCMRAYINTHNYAVIVIKDAVAAHSAAYTTRRRPPPISPPHIPSRK